MNELVKSEHTKTVDHLDALKNADAFTQTMKMATFLSKSTFIPKDFQNNPSDCLIALQMSASLGVSAFDVMNGIYVVHGRPSFSAKFAIALANAKGPFENQIVFTPAGKDDDLEVTASATLKGSKEKVSATISFKDVQKAGWTVDRHGALLKSYAGIPEQMLIYKAALMLIRRYCPEITMGMVSVDEAQELEPISKENQAIEAINQEVEENKNA